MNDSLVVMIDGAEAVSFHTDGASLEGSYLIMYDDNKPSLVVIRHGVAMVYTNKDLKAKQYGHIGHEAELGDIALAARRQRPRSAFKLPPGKVQVRGNRVYAGMFLLLIGVVLGVGVPLSLSWDALWVSMVALVAVLFLMTLFPKGNHRYVIGNQEIPIAELIDPSGDEQAGVAMVEGVKQEYGRPLTNAVYRIENAALFDPASELSATFTEKLARWDYDRNRMRPDQRQSLASEIRVAFDAARAYACHVGLGYLPATAQPPARVAAKALRLATNPGASRAEQRAARKKAEEILLSLKLYYLPRLGELAQILGGKPLKALPGRRAEVRS